MNVLGSLSFWVIFAIVLAVSIFAVVLLERAKRRRPTQRRGVRPHEQAKLISAYVGTDGSGSRGTYVHHVTTDPQAYAKAFVPSDHKD